MLNDLRFAFGQLLKNPGFTAVGVLTLALDIVSQIPERTFRNKLANPTWLKALKKVLK